MASDEDWQATVAALKSAADDSFSKGDYNAAISGYSQAISIDDRNHVLYSNRSASYLKLGEKSKALKDAEQCVSLKPDWEKAYGRLGAAQHALGRYDKAEASYKRGLLLAPDSAALQGGAAAARAAAESDARTRKRAEEEEEAKAREEKAREDGKGEEGGGGEDDDLLGDFFGEVAAVTAVASSSAASVPKEVLPQAKYTSQSLGTSADQIGRVLSSNYAWKNLNPFHVLQLDIDMNSEDLKARYKKLSSLVHPDKNLGNVEEAAKAFDEVKRAYEALKDEANRKVVEDLVRAGRERAAREFAGDRSAVAELEELERKEVMKVFAEVENNRRDLERRMLNQKKRERSQEDEEQDKRKKEYKFEKEWRDEGRMGNRMAGWQDFSKKGGPKKKDDDADDDDDEE